MATTTLVCEPTIVLNFVWAGPNAWHGGMACGGVDARAVALEFKEPTTKPITRRTTSLAARRAAEEARATDRATAKFRVHLENINPDVPKKLLFKCDKGYEEIDSDSLCLTIEQVRNLALKVGLFEKGEPTGPKISDSSGKITQQQTFRKTDISVKLETPEALELGQIYNLVVSSSLYPTFSAYFVKEGTIG